jgi:hypothetical protein
MVTNDGSGSSERIAASFMSDGRPAAGNVVGTDFSSSLPINPQQPGKDFVSWAVNGYSLDGAIRTPGMSNHDGVVPTVSRNSGNSRSGSFTDWNKEN